MFKYGFIKNMNDINIIIYILKLVNIEPTLLKIQ